MRDALEIAAKMDYFPPDNATAARARDLLRKLHAECETLRKDAPEVVTQAAAIQAGAADIASRAAKLTSRQREALDLRAAGLLCREAAEQMGIGRWAYQDLCKKARKKLEVTSTTEAAALVSTGQAMRYRAALMLARDAMQRREPRHTVMAMIDLALMR